MDNNTLSLSNIRNVLARLEETIIFGFIERVQFCRNPVIYEKDGVGRELGGESLVGFLLHESERAYAKVRRYTSPDEHPFFDDLPAPILPPVQFDNPLCPNAININREIRAAYEAEMIPLLCAPGDDGQWGSSAVGDVLLLQVLSKRIHYGKFVAESKYRAQPEAFKPLVRARDRGALMSAVTNAEVEKQVLDRVHRKATTYSQEVGAAAGQSRMDADKIRTVYARWVIPMNKLVQVLYLLQRPADVTAPCPASSVSAG